MANVVPGKSSYLAQSNALLRKNLTYQKRNKCQNCCLFVFPVVILGLLTIMNNYLQHLQEAKQNLLPPILNPPEMPPAIQIPIDQDLPNPNCRINSSCSASFLFTAYNQSFAQGVVDDMFPTPTSVNSSDLLTHLVLGTPSMSDNKNVSHEESRLYYLQQKCYKNSSIFVPIELDCMEGLTLWRNSTSKIHDELIIGDSRTNNNEEKEFAGAFDLQNSDNQNFNVIVWYKTVKDEQSSPQMQADVISLLNMVSIAFLRFVRGADAQISVEFFKDMPKSIDLNLPHLVTLMSTLLFIWIIVWLFPVMLQALVYEKQEKLRMMMKMHGLSDGAYWTISYGYFALVSIIYMLCFVAFGSLLGLGFFTMNALTIQLVFYFVYANLQVSLAFLASELFSNVKTASVVGYLLVFVTGLLGNFLFLNLLETPFFPRIWVTVLELFPGFSLFRGLYELQQYALEGITVDNGGMKWQDLNDPNNGMKEVVIIMFLEWLLTLFLAYYVDRVSISGCWWKKASSSARQPTLSSHESQISFQTEKTDVIQQRETVEQLTLEATASHAIVCNNIRKVYAARDGNPPKVAVKGMYLALPQTGCFGMLGPNGAGKTSFISMMIGLTKPTSGSAFINGLDMSTNMDEIYSMMGVCPQHDLLWETLTGREHLLFYGRLKNLKGAALMEAVEESLKNLNLFCGGVADKQAGKYSGGMKRRLSVAISLIGDPKVVFMDEPSTGLDPASRNSLWNVVKHAKQHRAIVLTTHSMEEAEALCDRLGIFVDGSLQCIADAKELKARYGGTLVFTLTSTAEHCTEVEEMVMSLSPNAHKTYHLAGTLKFELPKHGTRIADIFEAVEDAKKRFPVHAWGLTDTTLEDVFIKVARAT
ncbi:ABC transporter A family member 12-like isoform X1 [Amaranthus tricolor]|uniref:ABC transporter A family member 12-like isoform X1 n=1 Tax=Amaranthus tricolor TaxID=29722 RepID=UPI00258B6F50|nr:ABC transporter A family member 12-like isoform X1 [Amaranthus tricolor]